MLCGALLSCVTILPLSYQDDSFDRNVGFTPSELAVLDASCQSVPWLYTMGFVLQFSALFLKTWRLVLIFDNPKMKLLKNLHDKDLLMRMLPVVAIVFVINVCWLTIDPLVWDRVPLAISNDGLTVLSSVGLCTSTQSWTWVGALLGVMLCVLLMGLRLSWLSRSLPSDFNESAYISMALLVEFMSLLLAVPILSQITGNPSVSYIVKVIIVFLSSVGICLIIFLPKLWVVHYTKEDAVSEKDHKANNGAGGGAGGGGGGGGSKPASQKDNSFSKMVLALGVTGGKEQFSKAVSDFSSSAQLRVTSVKPGLEYESTHASVLHRRGVLFWEVMKDTKWRNVLQTKLRRDLHSEGLEFFICTLERNQIENPKDRVGATRTIIREFILNDARRQINISSSERDRILRAALAPDDLQIVDNDFFTKPALEACREIIVSKEFAEFLKEYQMSSGEGLQNLAIAGLVEAPQPALKTNSTPSESTVVVVAMPASTGTGSKKTASDSKDSVHPVT